MLNNYRMDNSNIPLQVADRTGIMLSLVDFPHSKTPVRFSPRKDVPMFTPAALVYWKSVKRPTSRSEFVTQIRTYKSLLSPALECAAESKALPLEWILDPSKPRTLLNRILGHLLLAEAKEPNPHYRDDYRIAWITCKWAFDGVHKPHVAATYRVLGVHPELVWNHILADRQAKLGKEFPDWYDAAGNLRPDVPKKPAVTSSGQVSPSTANTTREQAGPGTALEERGISPDSIPSASPKSDKGRTA